MASKHKYQAEGAAHARAAKLTKRISATYVTPEPGLAGSDSERETGGCTSWAGGVNHVLSESEDDWLSSEDDMESDSDGDGQILYKTLKEFGIEDKVSIIVVQSGLFLTEQSRHRQLLRTMLAQMIKHFESWKINSGKNSLVSMDVSSVDRKWPI